MKNPFSIDAVRKERLLREIMALRNEVNNFTREKDFPGKEESLKKLDQATELAGQSKFEESWGNFLDAEQILVMAMDDTQRQIRANLLLIESKKLKSAWRQDQIKFLLGILCSERLRPVSKDELFKAIAVRNDYYITRSHKMSLHTVSANILTLALVLILGGILALFSIWDVTNFFKTEANSLTGIETGNLSKAMIISGMFGALGAGFSFAKSLFSYNVEASKIPDQLLSMTVIALRFVIGASAAIIILLLFSSGFLKGVFDVKILESPVTYIVFSFVAGFSERWVVKMLGLVTKEKEKEKEKE
jgi:hypothetical protein